MSGNMAAGLGMGSGVSVCSAGGALICRPAPVVEFGIVAGPSNQGAPGCSYFAPAAALYSSWSPAAAAAVTTSRRQFHQQTQPWRRMKMKQEQRKTVVRMSVDVDNSAVDDSAVEDSAVDDSAVDGSAVDDSATAEEARKTDELVKEATEDLQQQYDPRRGLEENFLVVNIGKHECRSCGYEYDSNAGDPNYPVSKGTRFSELPEDWRCPTCGAAQSYFQSKGMEVAGFVQNQGYGLGGNSLTEGQKSLLIYGTLVFFFLLFLLGYLLQ